MSVREDKKRETRERLERAALDLFVRNGYEQTTVDDVAARAGVSARTAFRYFPAKSDLVFGESEADLAALRTELAAQDRSLPALEAARRALVALSERLGTQINVDRMRVIEGNPGLTARSLHERSLWADAIAADLAARRGQGGPDERDRLGGLLVTAILVSAFREWSKRGTGLTSLGDDMDRATAWAAQLLQP